MRSPPKLANPHPRGGRRRRPEASRRSILHAALAEFAQEGLAGARMDAIAEAAGVNKALLYYYFRDKDTLYGEVLDSFFSRLHERVMAVCDQPGTAGERFLAYAREHFDAIAESPHYARIFMGELMSASRGGATHLDRLAKKYMLPIGSRVINLVREGVAKREFREVDAAQFIPSAIGSIVHYFLTAPLRKKFLRQFPVADTSIVARRAAVLDFIAAALFADREAGVKLAARIAAQPTPSFRGKPVARTKMSEQHSAAARRSELAPAPAQPPMRPAAPAVEAPSSPVGYTWIDRWFPDVETARKVLQEEKEATRRRRAGKTPTTRGEEGEPE